MTELIWDGKYKDGKKQGPVRIALPFQTIETVNESAQDRLRTLELFAQGRQSEWRNRLIWGDKKYVLPSLLPEFAGKVNLIYIDPPFDTGADFSFTATIPDHPDSDNGDGTAFTKEPSILEQKAYRDTWGRGLDSYLQWFYDAVVLLRELLSENGSIYVHMDWHVGHYAKVVLDEVFGPDCFVNQIVWKRSDAHSDIGQGAKHLGKIYDAIFLYSKMPDLRTWNMQYTPLPNSTVERWYRHVEEGSGRRYNKADITGPGGAVKGNPVYEWKGIIRAWRFSKKRMAELEAEGRIVYSKSGMPYLKRYLDESKGVPLQDIWDDIAMIRGIHLASEAVGYKTQKPEALLERILKLSSNEGDLVLDCFVGSGTTAAVSEKLNRRWIACDLGRFATHTTRKRLLGIPGVKPFVVQNLGKYERQAWQVAEFPSNGKNRLEERRQREGAYRKFILDLYHATPVSGYSWLHGTKAGRMVHVGAVDAPVTLADVKAIAKEVWKAAGASRGTGVPPVGAHGQDAHATGHGPAPTTAAVDILGWEFAFELNETAKQTAAESRVTVAFKKIPHEALDKKAVDQGDVKFFELGALSVDMEVHKRDVKLTLKDFAIPVDDIPIEVRKAIKHWSQLVDYWAVDWDYKGDTFHNQWQSYRTRKEPKIELNVSYIYPEPGKYTIVVKVIDILGNDTTKTLEVTVK
jgi:adenine-specific DNA-methyltransferase